MPPASWASLPNKGQLAIITSIRVVDFFQIASLQAYMYKYLESFSTGSTPSSISVQVGFLQGTFTAAQVLSAIWWGRVSDTAGRKPVLLIGLIGTSISYIGVAFSRSYKALLIWRIFAGGINGTVGSARATLAETAPREYHPRAFLLLPLAFNLANTFGPILGVSLADPVERYPALFGQNSVFGGLGGVAWMLRYPYAAPNLLCALLLSLDAVVVWLCLRETAPNRRPWPDYGLERGFSLRRRFGCLFGRRRSYDILRNIDNSYRRDFDDGESHDIASNGPVTEMVMKKTMHLRRIWSSNFLLALLTTAVLELHLGGLSSLWPLFISSPHRNAKDSTTLPFYFTGGLGFQLSQVGLALAIFGILGLAMQLVLYPCVIAQHGLLYPFRLSLWLYPIAYLLTPYLSLLPFNSAGLIWIGILVVQAAQVVGRTFALPATILLLNYSCPHPSLLGLVYGIGSSVSGTSRTLGSIMAGTFDSIGLENEMSGLAWWIFALVSIVGCLLSFMVRDNLDE